MSGPRKRASTLDNVLADVRDRVRINGLDSVQHATLRPWVDGVSSNAVAARLTTEHEGVASDFRECMLAAASMAVATKATAMSTPSMRRFRRIDGASAAVRPAGVT